MRKRERVLIELEMETIEIQSVLGEANDMRELFI
jgi:hypothetical protein